MERNPWQISHSLTVLCFLQKIFRSRWRQSETELVVTTAYWIWTLSLQINFGMFRQTTNLVFWKHYCMEMWVNVPNVKYQIRYIGFGNLAFYRQHKFYIEMVTFIINEEFLHFRGDRYLCRNNFEMCNHIMLRGVPRNSSIHLPLFSSTIS